VAWLADGMIAIGVALIVIAALGVVTLPDLFSRMHAATKTTSLGLSLILLGAAVLHGTGFTALKREGTIPKELEHRQAKYVNNRREGDHGLWNGAPVEDASRSGGLSRADASYVMEAMSGYVIQAELRVAGPDALVVRQDHRMHVSPPTRPVGQMRETIDQTSLQFAVKETNSLA
jgi:hypothetical protein